MAPTTNKYDVATWLQAALIATATLWVFSPAFHGTWLMDDGLYVLENPLQHDPARLWKTWFVPGSFIEYYPMEETVRWAQWQLWGAEPLGYHLTNVGLQIVSALLVWRLLAKLGLRLAWIGGLIFAVHPVQVESVAWIAELKNLLSLTPFLLAMAAWIDFEERRDARDYWLALGLFLVAMLCKISAAPFPAQTNQRESGLNFASQMLFPLVTTRGTGALIRTSQTRAVPSVEALASCWPSPDRPIQVMRPSCSPLKVCNSCVLKSMTPKCPSASPT